MVCWGLAAEFHLFLKKFRSNWNFISEWNECQDQFYFFFLKSVSYCTLDVDSNSIRELNLLKSTCIKDGTLSMRLFLTEAYGFISCRDILITNLDASISYDELCDEVHEMCNLQQEQPITLKWIDDEGIVLKSLIILIFWMLWYREALKQLKSHSCYVVNKFINATGHNPVL